MNTPNTTAPSRIELPGGYYWQADSVGGEYGFIRSPTGSELFWANREDAERFADNMFESTNEKTNA